MIDYKKRYLRNTHIDREYRKNMDYIWKRIPQEFTGLIHSLDPKKPMNIYEIMTEIYTYASQYPMENDASFYTPELVQATLKLLVNFDMVKEVNV